MKTKCLLFFLVLTFTSSLCAGSRRIDIPIPFEVDGLCYENTYTYDTLFNRIYTDKVYITRCTDNNIKDKGCINQEDVIVPSEIFYENKTYQVIGISNKCFANCTKLLSVTIPNSIKRIGSFTFRGCINLKELVIPESITHIDGNIVIDCFKLEGISVDENNTNYSSLDGVLFNKNKTTLIACPGGKSGIYTIPEGVDTIHGSAFSGCENLTEIIIPSTVKEIDSYSFANCDKLTSIIIPENVSYINNSYFENCANLENITIKNNHIDLSSQAFDDTKWYNSQKEGLIYLDHILYSYKGEIPENTRIKIREGITTISYSIFRNSVNLEAVYIPKSVIYIGGHAFAYCKNLKEVIVYWEDPHDVFLYTSTFKHFNKEKITLYVPKGTKKRYKQHKMWKEFNIKNQK